MVLTNSPKSEHWRCGEADVILQRIFSPAFGKPHRSRLDAVCRKHGLRLLTVFGSQCSGAVHSESDVDVGVLPEPRRRPNFETLYVDLVPLLGNEQLDIVDLRKAPPVLRSVVVRDGVVLWARDAGEWLEFANRAVRDFDDDLPMARFRMDRLERILHRGEASEAT